MKYLKTGIFFLLVIFYQTVTASQDGIFKDLKGVTHNVEDFMGQGKWLVMMIWASDCPVCNQEAESYAHLHEEANNIHVLGLSIDGETYKTNAQDFVEQHDLPFTNLITDRAGIMLYYQEQTFSTFVGTPTFLVFNPQGELMAAQAGGVPADVIKKFIAGKSSSQGG